MSEPKLKVDASEFIEHTCEFADDIMQRQLGEKTKDKTYSMSCLVRWSGFWISLEL